MKKEITCPHCGYDAYAELYTASTLMAWVKTSNGSTRDPNTYTTTAQCLNCNKKFLIIKCMDDIDTKPIEEEINEWEACTDCKINVIGYHNGDEACLDCPVLNEEQRKDNKRHREYVLDHGLFKK